MIKKLALFFVLMGYLSLASASFNCILTNDPLQCNHILESTLSETQKDQLLSALLYNSTTYPDHKFIFTYNTNIKVNASIENLTIVNSAFIKNAWLSLLTIMPSILEDDLLYVPSNVFALSAYNYTVALPPDYTTRNYPETFNGDCKTTYTLTENTPTLNLFVNNQLQGHEKLQPLTIDQDAIIAAQFTVRTTIQQDHYRWKAYCRAWDRFGNCVSYEYKCDYLRTDHLRDHVDLKDSMSVKYYDQKLSAQVTVLDAYYNTTKLQFQAENYTNLNIHFQNSTYKEQKYTYSIALIKKPFYLAVLTADKMSIKQANNLIADINNTLFVKNNKNCAINVLNHFYSFNTDCNVALQKEEREVFHVIPFTYDVMDFLKVAVFVFVLYLMYSIAKYVVVRIQLP